MKTGKTGEGASTQLYLYIIANNWVFVANEVSEIVVKHPDVLVVSILRPNLLVPASVGVVYSRSRS